MAVDAYLATLKNTTFFGPEDTKGSVRWYIKWYRDAAPRKRSWFRTLGAIGLFLSISLPFITSLAPEPDKAIISSAIAWAIALVGGANGFFQFNRTWQGYIEAQFKLERLLMEWELAVSNYFGKESETDLQAVQELTKSFVITARSAITDETNSFFEEVKFPNINLEKEPTKP